MARALHQIFGTAVISDTWQAAEKKHGQADAFPRPPLESILRRTLYYPLKQMTINEAMFCIVLKPYPIFTGWLYENEPWVLCGDTKKTGITQWFPSLSLSLKKGDPQMSATSRCSSVQIIPQEVHKARSLTMGIMWGWRQIAALVFGTHENHRWPSAPANHLMFFNCLVLSTVPASPIIRNYKRNLFYTWDSKVSQIYRREVGSLRRVKEKNGSLW